MAADNKKTQSLNIFLIKEDYKSVVEIVSASGCNSPIAVPVPELGDGHLYVKRNPAKTPNWVSLFRDAIDIDLIGKSSSISAILVVKSNGRFFALTFGQGGRFLLKDDVYEERFGLFVALNTVEAESLRCVDKQSLDSLESHTRIQSGYGTSADQFGLDVEQDMLKTIVGCPKDHRLGQRMTGTDALSVSVKMELNDLKFLLDSYKDKFEEDLGEKGFDWVNNISALKCSSTLVPLLEDELLRKFKSKDYSALWLSIPEIIQWDTVTGFVFTSGKKVAHSDINLNGFLETVENNDITIELLKNRKVSCVDTNHNPTFKSWSIYKCLYAEVKLDEQKYILNDGKWFNVNEDFVKRTNIEFGKIKKSCLTLPAYKGGGEGEYNKSVSNGSPDVYALMDDKNKIFHGGGQGQVEVCDLFSNRKNLIHVKRYGKSSVLSHLFSQGFVSGQLIQLDSSFREKFKNKLPVDFKDLIDVEARPSDREFTVTYAVISDSDEEDLYLPFFSRVNLNNTVKVLSGFGFSVEVLKIPVDETHSKTKIFPPSKKAKK